MTGKARWTLAVVILVVGAVVAWRAIQRAAPERRQGPPAPVAVDPDVRERLASVTLETRTTPETLPAVLDMASRRVSADASEVVGSAALPAGAAADLADVFRERLHMTLDGDYETNVRYNRARGSRRSEAEREKQRAWWDAPADLTRMAPVSLDGVEVRVLFDRGQRVSPDGLTEGWSTATFRYTDAPFGLPEEPGAAGMTIAEVRLPMEKETYEGESVITLVGYQFVWSSERSQWIPHCTVVYSKPNEGHYGVKF